MKRASKALALAFFCAASINTANAIVITFDHLAGTNIPGSFHVATGLTMFNYPAQMNLNGFNFGNTSFNIVGPGNANYTAGDASSQAWNGSDFLTTTANFTVKQIGGGAFNLNSFDLARTFSGFAVSLPTVTVTGYFANGGSISQNLSVSSKSNALPGADFHTYTLNGFQNLSYFKLTTPASISSFSIDNLNVAAAPVPEPETYAMLLAGLGLIGFAVRRRKPTQAAA